MQRGLHILALVALLINCSPLRTCALQYVFSGTSCHDTDLLPVCTPATSASLLADGCAPHASHGHDNACLCERPKVSVDRVVPTVSAASPPAGSSACSAFAPEPVVHLAASPPSLTNSPPPVHHRLPLLI